ncbi:hypothetical protein O0882_18260 [Janthinobacterium sp. SUN073]|nr:hypothetical protein [Janthinobacterium sp. SUN073]MDN2698261.1 hypothetical protein [Janthinobacterium sp. SUN073]
MPQVLGSTVAHVLAGPLVGLLFLRGAALLLLFTALATRCGLKLKF